MSHSQKLISAAPSRAPKDGMARLQMETTWAVLGDDRRYPADMTFSLDQLPLDSVRKAAAADSHAAISQLLQRPDSAQLHGFCICTDPDITSVYRTAETHPQLRVRGESLLSLNHKAAPHSKLTLESAIEICRCDPADWTINRDTESDINLDSLTGAIASAWNVVDSLPDSDQKILEHCPATSRAVLRAIGKGLLEFSESFDWPPTDEGGRLSLLVWENDPDYPEVVRELANLLNGREIFDRFCDSYEY